MTGLLREAGTELSAGRAAAVYPASGVTWRPEDQGNTVRPQYLLLSPRGPKERGLSRLVCVAEGT